MAKVKYKSSHHFQKLFIIFGVLFSLAALGIIVYSSQKPTNTQSDASGGCLMTPQVRLASTEGSEDSVIYNFSIKNNSSRSCKQKLYYVDNFEGHSIPPRWGYGFITNGYGVLKPQAKYIEKIEFTPPPDIANGEYNLKFSFCRTKPDFSRYDEELAYYKGKTDNCPQIKLKYIKD